MKFSNYWIVAALGFTLGGFATTAHAQAAPAQKAPPQDSGDDDEPVGPWLGRIRGYDFVPANHSGRFTYLGLNFPKNALQVSQKYGFEGDITHFFKKNYALELSVSNTLQSSESLQYGGPLGYITQMPVSLIAQYHYQVPKLPVNAYVGLGLGYSRISKVTLNAGGSNPLDMKRDMLGPAYQIGVDISLAQGFLLNIDFRHMQLASNLRDVNTNSLLTDANMAPNFFSIGIGYRF
jgi:outer membrane protein W